MTVLVITLRKDLFNIVFFTFTLVISFLILFHSSSYAVDVSLAWDANTEPPDLAGYYIYYKTGSSGVPYNGTEADEGSSPIKAPLSDLNDPSNPEYVIHGLSNTETSFFVVTAYDTDENESGSSNEAYYQPSSNTDDGISTGGSGGGGGCFIATAAHGLL